MSLDLEKIRADSNRRIAVEDLELLQRCCDYCRAKTILEIGSADGGSSIVLGTEAKKRGGHLYCIEPVPKSKMIGNMKSYGLDGHYTLVPEASPWVTLDLKSIGPIDLLFIDGRHDIRWCLVDYHYFEPFVRDGGVIIFHDTGGTCQEDKKQQDYGLPGYVPLVKRAINIILSTDIDRLIQFDKSDAADGGAMAFLKRSEK